MKFECTINDEHCKNLLWYSPTAWRMVRLAVCVRTLSSSWLQTAVVTRPVSSVVEAIAAAGTLVKSENSVEEKSL